jgi:hypothetical protein
MSRGALISWKAECDTIHGEMDRLLTAGWPGTAEERLVRKIQFMALIERRNVSAQKFLKPGSPTDPDLDPSPQTRGSGRGTFSSLLAWSALTSINNLIDPEHPKIRHRRTRCARERGGTFDQQESRATKISSLYPPAAAAQRKWARAHARRGQGRVPCRGPRKFILAVKNGFNFRERANLPVDVPRIAVY